MVSWFAFWRWIMKEVLEAKVSTMNKILGLFIEVEVEYTVAADLDEAIDWAGSEEKLVEIFNVDTIKRRKANAARTELRDATVVQDWDALALRIGEEYAPGRKGGSKKVEVSESAMEDMTPDELKAYLQSKGVVFGS